MSVTPTHYWIAELDFAAVPVASQLYQVFCCDAEFILIVSN